MRLSYRTIVYGKLFPLAVNCLTHTDGQLFCAFPLREHYPYETYSVKGVLSQQGLTALHCTRHDALGRGNFTPVLGLTWLAA